MTANCPGQGAKTDELEPEVKKKKRKGETPTSRTKKRLTSEGWTVGIVERTIPGTRITQDLYGFIDLLAVRGRQTLAVQATSDNLGSHGPDRVRKILASPNFPAVLEAQWAVEVWAWWQNAAGAWIPRITRVHAGMLFAADCAAIDAEVAEQ